MPSQDRDDAATAPRKARRRKWIRSSIWDYGILRRYYAKFARNRRFQIRSPRVRSARWLNVGCGGNPMPEFVNLDYGWNPGVDLCWDLTRGIPLPSESLDGVYSEHCLEHVSLRQAFEALLEFRRLLRPGGSVRIAVPDGELYLDLYRQAQEDPNVQFPGGPKDGSGIARGITPMVIVNRAFRAFGHRFAYDYATFSLLLGWAGFVDIQKETFRSGRTPELLVDYEKRAANSLYVEASKPEGDAEPPQHRIDELVRYLNGGPP